MTNTYDVDLVKAAAGEEPGANAFFTLNAESSAIDVEEGNGNSFHLGPILRKYTSAKLAVKPGRRTTSVELPLLWDALGLLRSLQYDTQQFNSAFQQREKMTASEMRYACYRLSKQASAFGVRVPRAGAGVVHVPGLDELVRFVERINAPLLERSRTLLAGGIVDFAGLCEQYRPGTDLLDRGAGTGLFGAPTAMRVRACFYSRGKSLFGVVSTFYAALEFVVSVGDKFAVVETHFPMNDFQGTRSTSEGMDSFVQLSEAMKQDLLTRGGAYAKLTRSCALLEYLPGSFMPVAKPGSAVRGAATRMARVGGRIMIDSAAAWTRGVHCARSEGVASDAVKGVLKLAAQRLRTNNVPSSEASNASSSEGATFEEESLELLLLADLPSALLHLTWPVLAGFSFRTKSWGVVMASGLREARFNTAAFDRLVLPPEKKRLIEALVVSYSAAESGGGATAATPRGGQDIIEGKGEGTIFLLHGPPGVGKTLTAEAVAERLGRPLYIVSMGELGTTPETLEERLMDVFDLCLPWGALILIDEAEMLLERRTTSDVVRNAMVCIMLRLLEYYSGILFLTTNRIDSLDPAFQSRVHCALKYEALDQSSRRKIWEDLLKSVAGNTQDGNKSNKMNVEAMSRIVLNGRQIKNALQLAVALCRHEGVPLSQKHLDETVKLTAAAFPPSKAFD